MSDPVITEQELPRQYRRGCFFVGTIFCLLLTALLSYGYFSLKRILVGNGVVWTSNLYSSYLRCYKEKFNEYPTCQPVDEFAWLSISDAICREKYNSQQDSPEVWQGVPYDEFLDYDDDTIRVAIRQQNSGHEGFCLVYFHGFGEDVIREIDEAVRSGRFRGSNSLESLLKENRGELRLCYHFERVFDAPVDQVIDFLEVFYRGELQNRDPLADANPKR